MQGINYGAPQTAQQPQANIQGTSGGQDDGMFSGGLGGALKDYGQEFTVPGMFGMFGTPGMDELEQGIGEAEGTLQPYADMGVPAWQQYQQESGRMLDPGQFEGDIMQGFQGSPGSEYAMGQATGMLNRRASALGITGGGALSGALQKQRQNLALQDWNNELARRTGIFQGGTQGLQQIGTMGANAAGNIANLQMQQGSAESQAKQAQQQGIMGMAGAAMGGMF